MITQLAQCSIGNPITRGGVSLFPVYSHQPDWEVLAGPNTGVRVAERPDAQVPTLVVQNPNAVPVLIAEGETLNGGRQDRIINVSVLIPAGTEIEIPVSCVESGRWHGSGEFGRSVTLAPRRVRRGATSTVTRNMRQTGSRRSDQGLVWQMVEHELDLAKVSSETCALGQLVEHEQRNTQLAKVIAELVKRGPLRGQTGIVVCHGRRVVAADVYATPSVLSSNWEALVRGHFLEVRGEASGVPSASKALKFLMESSKRVVAVTKGVGLGEEYRIESPKMTGQALVHDGLLVHASAFALAG